MPISIEKTIVTLKSFKEHQLPCGFQIFATPNLSTDSILLIYFN